jgi:multiple sugar transport system ATP-binding protein
MPAIEFRSVDKTYADGTRAVVSLDLSIADGEFLCILGPSGCGKSSSLRMLAGLEGISGGDILVGGRRINDVPPHLRDMAMVFENYALYPHLDVFHNIAMPLTARRVASAEIRERVSEIAGVLRITDLLDKRPRILSGGQRQRVALGRALIRHPQVFLMDEPLGHLEAYLRVELRSEMRRLHDERGTTSVYITHDQQEAGAVADRIAVMSAGRLQQVGSLLDLLDRPVNRFVAEFVGEWPMNMMPASVAGAGGVPALRVGDAILPATAWQQARLRSLSPGEGEWELGCRPDDLEMVGPDTDGALRGRVVVVEPQGDTSVVVVDMAVGRIEVLVASAEAPAPGVAIGLRPDPARMHLFRSDGVNLFAGGGASDG